MGDLNEIYISLSNYPSTVSVDFVNSVDLNYVHRCQLQGNVLSTSKEPIVFYSNNGGASNTTRQHKYSLRIFRSLKRKFP